MCLIPASGAAAEMADFLDIRDLSVGFATENGTARVLDHVSFSMRQGEIMGLVGESGCGKTTLARAILGVLPDSAEIANGTMGFDGADLLAKDTSEIRGRLITFIPQDPFGSFSPLFTVGDQIGELMRWKSPDRAAGERRYAASRRRADHARVLAALRDVQLPDAERLLRKYPHELSGGQRQRVMIAMALLPEPKLVIADEPTTALDVTIQAQILDLLRDLQSELGMSVILISHDLGVIAEFAQRVMVMYAGRVVEQAPSRGLYRQPMHPYTTGLLAAIPPLDHDVHRLPTIPGSIPDPGRRIPGCRFSPRCAEVEAGCRESPPELVEVGDGHFARCPPRLARLGGGA